MAGIKSSAGGKQGVQAYKRGCGWTCIKSERRLDRAAGTAVMAAAFIAATLLATSWMLAASPLDARQLHSHGYVVKYELGHIALARPKHHVQLQRGRVGWGWAAAGKGG